ncbi:MAG: L-threonylcarbamoyladenylate synthase [Halothiobacillaceae bacterium]
MDKPASRPAWPFRRAAACLRAGGLVAYPTEAVYGLGCDPLDEGAISRLLAVKYRPWSQGLILVAAQVEQLQPYLATVPESEWNRVLPTWPGPHTWLLPAAPGLSRLLTGRHERLAVRVSADPRVAALCRAFGGPLVSTSANRSGLPPARSAFAVRRALDGEIDLVVGGAVDRRARPSTIRDARDGRVLRA